MFRLIAIHYVFHHVSPVFEETAPRRAHQEFQKGWPRITAGQRRSPLFATAKSLFV